MTQVVKEEHFRTPLALERSLGLWVDRIGFARGDVVKPERYRQLGQYAVLAVENGTGVLETIGRPSIELAPGDMFLLFPDMAARYGPYQRWDSFWVVWNGAEAALLERMSYIDEKIPVIRGGAPVVLRAWERLGPLMAKQDRGALLERKTAILEMIRELSVFGIAGAPALHPAVGEAVKAMMREPDRRRPVAALAREAHVSPAYFRRLFKVATGSSPKAFQAAQRINRAKELLTQGRTIKETSAALGFTDVFHFMRVFKRLTHQTAGQYVGRRRA